uniref:Uncharacterized protein n=1 Tax=Rhizophagus irregularis (strain DAOM 181602 / DAOM 197198 / MUCL 43194) TaxID=747089 RepID=U9U8M3_RHIID
MSIGEDVESTKRDRIESFLLDISIKCEALVSLFAKEFYTLKLPADILLANVKCRKKSLQNTDAAYTLTLLHKHLLFFGYEKVVSPLQSSSFLSIVLNALKSFKVEPLKSKDRRVVSVFETPQ